jgi:hypothetical protein
MQTFRGRIPSFSSLRLKLEKTASARGRCPAVGSNVSAVETRLSMGTMPTTMSPLPIRKPATLATMTLAVVDQTALRDLLRLTLHQMYQTKRDGNAAKRGIRIFQSEFRTTTLHVVCQLRATVLQNVHLAFIRKRQQKSSWWKWRRCTSMASHKGKLTRRFANIGFLLMPRAPGLIVAPRSGRGELARAAGAGQCHRTQGLARTTGPH